MKELDISGYEAKFNVDSKDTFQTQSHSLLPQQAIKILYIKSLYYYGRKRLENKR